MKPDGKIQGVDVWVSRLDDARYYIVDRNALGHCKGYLRRDGMFHKTCEHEGFWPSREAALAHLRELEEKERPVIDLSTAKFGDKFKRDDGVIETYACLKEHSPGWHLMQSGQSFRTDGSWSEHSNPYRLVAPYTPPRTVWAQWCELDSTTWLDMHPTRESADSYIAANAKIKRLAIAQLTEGEGLAEPDVA